jgi:NTP pyrophosphatase (non-canonical NTP hydrolase)
MEKRSEMHFDVYQDATAETALYPDAGTGAITALAYAALGLSGEGGEIANKVKKILRDDQGVLTAEKADAIEKELGDVLWYIARVATEIGSDLNEIATANLAKLRDRADRGVIQGSGDNR